MFGIFGGRKRRKKGNWRSSYEMDVYELSERETDMLMGGSPVRQLIGDGHQNHHHHQHWTDTPVSSTLNGWNIDYGYTQQPNSSHSPSWLQQVGEALPRNPSYPYS